MGTLTLILGGARSGKSTFAEQLAHQEGGEQVLYVATAEAGDDEMHHRIEKHRRNRPAGWHTLETPRNAGQAIAEYNGQVNVVLIDCLTMLVSNSMGSTTAPFAGEITAQVDQEVEQLLAAIRQVHAHTIVVSNEVGMGLVPSTPLGRAYRDLLGGANQKLARAAASVILMVAGLPLIVKGDKQELG